MLRTRNAKVFSAALISILIGVVFLKMVGNTPPRAGAFSLSDYYNLQPVEELIGFYPVQARGWNSIEIYCISDNDINSFSPVDNSIDLDNIDCHFIICNGDTTGNGEIQTTQMWQKQLTSLKEQSYNSGRQTIRICIIIDNQNNPTDFQVKRAEALTEALSREFNIFPSSIYYPKNW